MKTLVFVTTAILSLTASAAFAGATNPQPVVVDTDAMTAFGAQFTARSSKNDVELIGCGTRVIDIGGGATFSFGFCNATDENEVTVTCTTENADLIDAMEANTAFTFITFSWQDDGMGGAECIRVGFSTQSFYLPNFTTKGSN